MKILDKMWPAPAAAPPGRLQPLPSFRRLTDDQLAQYTAQVEQRIAYYQAQDEETEDQDDETEDVVEKICSRRISVKGELEF